MHVTAPLADARQLLVIHSFIYCTYHGRISSSHRRAEPRYDHYDVPWILRSLEGSLNLFRIVCVRVL